MKFKRIHLIPILSVLMAIALGAQVKQSVSLTSFNAGEMSPLMNSRVDFPKYRGGAKTLQNMLVRSQGPVTRRPGTKYIAEVKDSNDYVRLIPFEYSTSDAYVLELGDDYIRFYRNGAQVLDGASAYELVSPWDANDLFEIQFAQDAQYMRFVHPDYAPYKLTRNSASHTDWTLGAVDFVDGPFIDENDDESITVYADAIVGEVNVVADANIFDANHVGALWQITHLVDSNTITARFWGGWTVVGGGVAASADEESDGTWESNTVTVTVYEHQAYTVTTGGDWYGSFKIQRSYDDGTTWNTVKTFAYNQNGNVLYTGTEEEDDALYRLRLEDQQVSTHMKRHSEGECDVTFSTDVFLRHGVVKITAYTDANEVDANVVTELASTEPTWRWAEGAWSTYRGWPRTVEHHEQRCLYGGTASYPQTIWASVTSSQDSDYDDFDEGLGVADDAWTYVLPGMNPIQWMKSTEYLMVGTTDGVGRLGLPDKPIDPTWPPAYRQQARNGCAYMDAVAAIDAILYVERGNQGVREVTYTYAEDRYIAPDMTILAEHIAREGITQIDFQNRPDPMLWAVRADGVLLSFTYERKHEVLAWARHITGQDPNDLTSWDDFESVAVIPGTSNRADATARVDDELWVVVKRTVDSNEIRYVEQVQSLDWGDDPNYCWFVDAAGYGTSGGGGSLTAGAYQYPTLQELTSAEIPTAATEPSMTAATNEVANAVALQAMTGAGKYYLSADIDLMGVAWTPITNFSGVLDGRGYTISNLSINAPASDSQALFGSISAGFECYDLTLDTCSVTGDGNVAILVAKCNASATFEVKDVNIVDCTVTGGTSVGPLFGIADEFLSGTIYNCTVTNATVNAEDFAGGMLGYMDPKGTSTGNFDVVDCTVTGTMALTTSGVYAGGFVGSVESGNTAVTTVTFHSCTTSMSITSTNPATNNGLTGGFVGYPVDYASGAASSVQFVSCAATGNIIITGTESVSTIYGVGGFVGFHGGVVSYIDCHATGNITIDASHGEDVWLIGGFGGKWDVDYPEEVLRCYATGDIAITASASCTWYGIGGFIGGYLGTAGSGEGGAISRSWSEGDITLSQDGDPFVSYGGGGLGGFIGLTLALGAGVSVRDNTIENCYSWGSITITSATGHPEYTSVAGFIGTQAEVTNPINTVITNAYCAQTDIVTGSGYTAQIPSRDLSAGFIGEGVETALAITEANSYFDQQTSSHNTDVYALPKTTLWLQTRGNFESAGWDFDTIWYLPDATGNGWSGMTWGVGEIECVYADGRPIGTFTVDADGVLDVNDEYDVVIAGLNYYSIVETMPLVNEETIGRPTFIKSVALDFHESMGAHVGADLDHSADWKFSDDDFNTPIQPFTGYKPATGYAPFLRGTSRTPTVYLWEWSPVPMTIRSITANMEVTVE